MNLRLFDMDAFCKDLKEVSSPKIFESGKFAKDGLFSQQIFGPVKSFCCACNRITYRGRTVKESKCERCGIDITSSDERRKRYGKVSLPFKLLNPMFYYITISAKSAAKIIINDMLCYNRGYYEGEKGKLIKIIENTDVPEDAEILIGLKGVISYIESLIENDSRQEFQYMRENFDKITIQNILVIPPDFRPCGSNASGKRIADEINELYNTIIVRSNRVKDIPYTVGEDDDIYRTNFKHIQVNVIKLFEYILGKMSKKKGLIRSNILGKRLDFSGRAVISPDPTLKLDQCRIPYWTVLEILKPQLTTHLVNKRVCKRYNQAVKLIEDCIQTRNTELFDIVSEFCNNKLCVLNRQPTLHRLGMLGFKITIHLGNTIQMHPMTCFPFNSDYDGDAMALYFPITKESREDVREKVGIWNNLISQTDTTLVPRPSQDIILGIFASTKDNSKRTRNIKGVDLPVGKYLFNKCLPEDYPIIDYVVDKKALIAILNDIVLRYSPEVSIKILDNIKSLGFANSTIVGYTLSVDDLYSEELEKISQDLVEDVELDMKTMSSTKVMQQLKQFKFADYIDSGARGSWDQMKQLVLSRGYVSDANGKIRPDLIRSSLVKGLGQKEFFNSCWGARKGLLDTALSTGISGYLTRQLIYSCITSELDDTLDDCGSTDYVELFVKDEKMAKSLLWRYYLNDDNILTKITVDHDIVGKTIKLRSPIYCKSKKICKKCYGDLHRILHSNMVGIMAVQSVGEVSVQLVLRTFHSSGVAKAEKQFETQEDIISGITIANKLFHNPESIIKINKPIDLVGAIYDVFSEYKGIHMVHYEVIVQAMMWAGDDLWRKSEDRDNVDIEWVSILKIPSRLSWLLGAAFSNMKSKLIEGLVYGKTDIPTPLSNLFRL